MSKDNDVGYGRPPKYTQFAPGESGNKGRKKKRPEFQAEMIARIRDERVTHGDKSITMFELAIRQVYNTTIKRGHPRDLKALFDLLDKYGAIPQGEAAEESRRNADLVMEKIMEIFDRETGTDPEDVVALDNYRDEEAAIVIKCPHCSPSLRERWNKPERKALSERFGCTGIENDIERLKKGNK